MTSSSAPLSLSLYRLASASCAPHMRPAWEARQPAVLLSVHDALLRCRQPPSQIHTSTAFVRHHAQQTAAAIRRGAHALSMRNIGNMQYRPNALAQQEMHVHPMPANVSREFDFNHTDRSYVRMVAILTGGCTCSRTCSLLSMSVVSSFVTELRSVTRLVCMHQARGFLGIPFQSKD